MIRTLVVIMESVVIYVLFWKPYIRSEWWLLEIACLIRRDFQNSLFLKVFQIDLFFWELWWEHRVQFWFHHKEMYSIITSWFPPHLRLILRPSASHCMYLYIPLHGNIRSYIVVVPRFVYSLNSFPFDSRFNFRLLLHISWLVLFVHWTLWHWKSYFVFQAPAVAGIALFWGGFRELFFRLC